MSGASEKALLFFGIFFFLILFCTVQKSIINLCIIYCISMQKKLRRYTSPLLSTTLSSMGISIWLRITRFKKQP